MAIETVALSVIDAHLLRLNVLLIPAISVVFSVFAPVPWNLAIFYVLVFHIASATGYIVGGFSLDLRGFVWWSGIALANALVCAGIVASRRRGVARATSPVTLRLLGSLGVTIMISSLLISMTYIARSGWRIAGSQTESRFQEPAMVVIPPGQFDMGCVSGRGCLDRELPVHRVTFAKPFAIGRYEVTFAEYDRFAEATGRPRPDDIHWWRGRHPVINVSWGDAVAYAGWLSEQTGKRYRLPSEAEWEYAARAGTTTPFSTGACIDRDQANFISSLEWEDCPPTGVYRGMTMAAGGFPPNPWGLHEVHGNVAEWVQDYWHENYEGAPSDGSAWEIPGGAAFHEGDRVVRGGSWESAQISLRSGARTSDDPAYRSNRHGFRLARDLDE